MAGRQRIDESFLFLHTFPKFLLRINIRIIVVDGNFEKLSKLVTEIISAKTEVKRIASVATNFEELTQKLFELIQEKVTGVPEYLLRSLSQCLMRDYSLDSETHRMIYNAWYQTMKG